MDKAECHHIWVVGRNGDVADRWPECFPYPRAAARLRTWRKGPPRKPKMDRPAWREDRVVGADYFIAACKPVCPCPCRRAN